MRLLFRHWLSRASAVRIATLPLLLPASLRAYTYPVEYQGGPRAAATFVEDHGAWHAGIDLPMTDGGTTVHAAGGEVVFHAYTTNFASVRTELNDNATASGPWSITLSHTGQKYMLDILSVRRVTRNKPPMEYAVQEVVETQPGFADDEVELVPNQPGHDPLVAGDSLAVDFAYYRERIFQTVHVSAGGTEYRHYAHIDGVHKYVDWRHYPATAANRYYGMDSVVPSGRSAHVLNEGEVFADIETIHQFASEPRHVHFTLTSEFSFPVTATNPLANIVFPTDDPQGNRPFVRSIALLSRLDDLIFDDAKVYGGVDILVESRDDMGSPEANDDGDGAENAIREAGCYNAGYWVTTDGGAGEEIASGAQPNKMFEGNGKDTITGNDPLRAVLLPKAPYKFDVNTNYFLRVSHVEEDSMRFWSTRAMKGYALNDGSDAPLAEVNSQARFGDGRYTIHAKARDVVAYGAERDSMVIVDNFRPFVRKVVVSDDSGELYSGEWTFDGSEIVFQYADADEGMLDPSGNKRCADGKSDVKIEVRFSEGMKDAQMSAIEPLGYTPALARMPAGQDSIWVGTIPKAKLKTTRERAGRQKLEIFGSDWADNDVRQITTPAAIDPEDNRREGSVMHGSAGSDELHRFAICQPLALVVDVTGSMYDEIEDVKVAMNEVIDQNEADPDRFPFYNVITFEDDVHVRLSSKRADDARFILSSLYAGFGGACPEASVAALDSLPPLMPGGGVAVLATDADPLEGRPRLDATKAKLRSMDIEVNTLLSGSCESFFAKAPPSGISPSDLAAAMRGNADAPSSESKASATGDPVPTLSELFGTIDSRIAFHEMSNATGGLCVESFPNAEFVDAARIIAQRFPAGALLLSRRLLLPAPSGQVETISVDPSCSELLVVLNYTLGEETSLALRRPTGDLVLLGQPGVTITYAPAVACYRIASPAEGEWTAEVTCSNGQGFLELSALARSPRRLELGGEPVRRAGISAPISVVLDAPGAPSAFRLVRADGSEEQPLLLADDGMHDDGDASDHVWGGAATIVNPGEYRVAVDGADEEGSYTRESGRTLIVGLPDIASVDTLQVGTFQLGRTSTTPLYIKNVGVARLSVSGVEVDSPDFLLSPAPFAVEAGDMHRVDVSWTPSGLGSTHAIVSVASDDEDSPTHQVVLAGEVIPVVELSSTPDTLRIAMAQGETSSTTLRLRNEGAGSTSIALSDPAGIDGPSSSGYRYQPSYGEAPIPFRWTSLGPNAATVGPLPADGAAGPYPIGFEVELYGHRYTEFYISENGHITLGGLPALTAQYYGSCPPSSYFAPYLAPYLDNLDLRHGGQIRWQSDGEQLVVEYQDARRYDLHEQDVPLNCQIVLARDGSIDFNYLTVPDDSYPPVAIGSGAYYESLSPSCDGAFAPRARTSVHFWRKNPWMNISADANFLAPGDSLTVSVDASTTQPGLEVGSTYQTSIAIASDRYPGREVPVRLTILPGPYSIAGRVTAAEDGSGVANAIASGTGPYGSYRATTTGDGSYVLSGLTAGHYEVSVLSTLFLPAAPVPFDVPSAAPLDFALVRPIIELAPEDLEFTLAAGDSLCLPVVIRNDGTAPLVLSGIRRGEEVPTLFGPSFERILDDPRDDTNGPDLVALDVARGSSQLDFRLIFDESLSSSPPYAFISLDIDRDAETGANPPALGYGLATQTIGAEYELSFENFCGNYIYLFDAVTGEYLNGYYLSAQDDKSVTFSVPLADLGNDDGIMNVCVTSLEGYCDGGSRRPTQQSHARAQAPGSDHASEGASETLFDWMPEAGHGTIGTCPWLSVDPTEATIAPGDSVTVSVCVDASALADTSVGCSASLMSNDPRRPLAVLPINANISGTVGLEDAQGHDATLVFSLRQNDPNPFSGSTRIRFSLPREEQVRLSVFDLNGRLVRQVLNQRRPAGAHEVVIDPRELSSGVYLYRLEAGRRVATRKMILIN